MTEMIDKNITDGFRIIGGDLQGNLGIAIIKTGNGLS